MGDSILFFNSLSQSVDGRDYYWPYRQMTLGVSICKHPPAGAVARPPCFYCEVTNFLGWTLQGEA